MSEPIPLLKLDVGPDNGEAYLDGPRRVIYYRSHAYCDWGIIPWTRENVQKAEHWVEGQRKLCFWSDIHLHDEQAVALGLEPKKR